MIFSAKLLSSYTIHKQKDTLTKKVDIKQGSKRQRGQKWVVWLIFSQRTDSYPLRSLERNHLWTAWTSCWVSKNRLNSSGEHVNRNRLRTFCTRSVPSPLHALRAHSAAEDSESQSRRNLPRAETSNQAHLMSSPCSQSLAILQAKTGPLAFFRVWFPQSSQLKASGINPHFSHLYRFSYMTVQIFRASKPLHSLRIS